MASITPLLPSINRNILQIIDTNESGLVAYGCRSSIFIYNLNSLLPRIADTKLIFNAHRGKVLSLSFCKTNNELIASIGEDNLIRVWDLETVSCISSMEVKEGTRVVEWLHGNANCIVFPASACQVGKWNYARNNLVQIKTGSDSFIQILLSNKKSPELLAVSHSVGSISILNVDTQVLMYKLKSHVMEITSLCWSPISPTMLLSTSLDHTARVWNLGESKPIRLFNYPRSRKMDDKKYTVRLCGMFHPDNPDVIICSNVRGSLGEVKFSENEAPKFLAYDDKNNETGFKFVNVMIPYVTENNKTLLLTSDYLKIALWDISEKKLISSFCYLNGSIYDLTVSTLHPHLLAISSGDGCLRIWNLNETSKLDMTTIVVYTRIKIMTVAWHPSLENIIAYGSDEGRVGIADIQKKKSLYSFETHHSSAVYSMQWAPCLKLIDSEEEFFLYSCGGGIIYLHELHKPKVKPADFDDLITYPPDLEFVQKSHTEISWKSDYTCLIIGSFKGFLDLFDNKLNFLTRVTVPMKIAESIKWHPKYTFTSSSKGSDYSSWFAAAGNDENIQIFDTSDIENRENESSLCRPTKTLIAHKKKVSTVCWSPHIDGYMASASKDGTVLVWNVIANTIVANYSQHRDLVFSAHWSYFDPDVIYSGGMDCCLRVWKLSEQNQTSAPEKSQVIKRKPKLSKPKEHIQKEQFVERDLSHKDFYNSKNSSTKSPMDVDESKTEAREDSSFRYSKAKSEMKEFKRKMFADFVSRPKEKKLENILKLTDLISQSLDSSDAENMTLISDTITDEESLSYGLFCDQLTAVKMLEAKAKAEDEIGNVEKFSHLHIMANNIEAMLITAAQSKRLNDFLISAAATVSRKFYNEMCKKYVLQLIEEKSYMKASMYLLLCGELHDAVKLLLEKGKFLEALAIAKAQLPADDPFIHGALYKASNHFSAFNEFEIETECYLSLKEPSEAAKSLYRRADSSSIYASAYICKKFNLIEEAESYGYLCMEKCLAEAAWPTFNKLVNIIDSLKVYKLFVRVHELIFMQIKTLKKDGIPANSIFGITGSKLQIWESKAFGDSKISFLPFVHHVLESEKLIPEEEESLAEIRSSLDSMIAKRQKYETTEETHINLAIYTSQVIVSSQLNDFSAIHKYFMKLFPAAYNVLFLPRVVFWLFLPFDIYWCSNTDAFICENKYLESESSFLHFQDIYKSFHTKFASLNSSDIEHFSISHIFSCNLNEAVEQVLMALSKKTSEDSLILYFSVCYITELRRLAKNGWKYRCYSNVTSFDKKTEVLPENNSSLVCNETNAEKCNTHNDIKNSKDCELKSGDNCHDNIDQNIVMPLSSNADDSCLPKEVQLSSQDNDKNLPSIQNEQNDEIKQNDSTVSRSLISVEDNIKNLENSDTSSSTLFCKIKNLLISPYKDGNTTIENSLSKNSSNKAESAILSAENIDDEILVKESNTIVVKKEAKLENINGNIEEKEKVSSIDCNKENIENEEMSSDTDDDHLQCWSDVSFYYILTKCFTSAICKDEFALIFYLQKYLHYIDSAIANIAREQSKKSVVSNLKDLLHAKKDKALLNENYICNDLFKDENNCHENSVISCSSKTEEISDPVKKVSNGNYDNDCYTLEKDIEKVIDENKLKINLTLSQDGKVEINNETKIELNEKNEERNLTEKALLNGNYICKDFVKDENSCHENSVISCSSKTEEISDAIKQNDSNCSYDNEKNIKMVIDKNEVKINLTPTKDEKEEINNETYMEELNPKNEDKTISDLQNLNQEHLVSENLHFEHEKVSQLVKQLSSVEFYYPNPFDAVSTINELCCDIVHKNPCKFVKKKFHEFSHEINKWKTKFCIKDETVKCDICKEDISNCTVSAC